MTSPDGTLVDYEAADAVAADVWALPRPLLLALDVDGVLAPIVSHATQARLSPGVAESLKVLAHTSSVDVAVVSGRSLDGLRQFEVDPAVTVVGSHGAEVRGDPPPTLTARQEELLTRLTRLAHRSAADAGEGAWVELKPTSVVLHVRQAPPATAERARDALLRAASEVEGATVKPGHAVVELMARPADKGRAIRMLRERTRPRALMFAGDDVTDEDGFRVLDSNDIGVKVGPCDTHASRRLADPDGVRDFLQALVDLARR
jgi:trehalose-phosphatase